MSLFCLISALVSCPRTSDTFKITPRFSHSLADSSHDGRRDQNWNRSKLVHTKAHSISNLSSELINTDSSLLILTPAA